MPANYLADSAHWQAGVVRAFRGNGGPRELRYRAHAAALLAAAGRVAYSSRSC